MTHTTIKIIIAGLLVGLLHADSWSFGQQEKSLKVDISTAQEIEHSIRIGLEWLLEQQEDDGSWNHYPAITGLVLSAFLRAHPNITSEYSELAKSFEFLEKCVQKDGSIHVGDMPGYNTSICIVAFKDAKNPRYDNIIEDAEDFLRGLQIDEKEGYTTDSLYYGGVGYGNDERPDMSNLQWAIEAISYKEPVVDNDRLTASEKRKLDENKLFYDKALNFLARCQNLPDVNPEEYAGTDGGFIYEPGQSKAGGNTSYASMGYAGLKSMIYAKVDKSDHRVQAAVQWLSDNYSVTENPPIGNMGLFYNYQTMAKALVAYDEDILVDSQGEKHNWRIELANQLMQTQDKDGWWVNENGRWWENNPVLVTTYCILTLEQLL